MSEIMSLSIGLACTILMAIFLIVEGRAHRYWQNRCNFYEQVCDGYVEEVKNYEAQLMALAAELAQWKKHAEPFATVWQGEVNRPIMIPIGPDLPQPPLYTHKDPPYFSD